MDRQLITLGEAMVVFIAGNEGEFTEIESFSKGIAGAELNVSIGLSRLGNKVSYITRLGDDVFGHHIEKIIHEEGILAAYFFMASIKSSFSPPFMTASATAQVMTVSSVKKQSSRNKGNSFVFILCHS